MISITLLFGFMLVSAFLIFGFIQKVLTRPVALMISLVSQLEEGDFRERFQVKKNDEVGQIGNAINNLIDSLRQVFSDIADVMGTIENGNLSQPITSDFKGELDTIKKRINQSISILSSTIASVTQTAEQVQTSSAELVKSAEALSSGTTIQAATLEEISSSIVEIESHAKQVDLGVENSEKTSVILSEIFAEVDKSDSLISDIVLASEKQRSSISEINAGIFQVNDTVQQYSAIAEETAAASDELRGQSNVLRQEMSKFSLLEETATSHIEYVSE